MQHMRCNEGKSVDSSSNKGHRNKPEVHTKGIIIPSVRTTIVQVRDAVVTATDHIILSDLRVTVSVSLRRGLI